VTDVPTAQTYTSVVSRNIVRLALTIGALNRLDVKASDIMNAYVTAHTTKKIFGPYWEQSLEAKVFIRSKIFWRIVLCSLG